MFKYVLATIALVACSSSFASAAKCSELPSPGSVKRAIRLSDGSEVLFKAKLVVQKNNSFDEHVISHRYESPQAFVNGIEVAINVDGLAEIAKKLGYDSLGFREVQTNAGYLRKRQTLKSDGHSLYLEKSPKVSTVIAPMGFAKFVHDVCAPWQF